MTDEILDQASPPVDTVGKEQRRTRWLLYLQWVLVSAVGLAFLAWGTDQDPDGPVGLAVIGLGVVCMALGQWLVLRPRLARAGWWVLVTPVGLGLGYFAAVLGIWIGSEGFGWPDVSLGLLATLGIGTPLGLLQWLVLRGQMRRALWWLPVTEVATIGIGVLFLWRALWVFPELRAALGGVVAGAVYGAVTGVALVMFLPHPPQTRDRKRLPSRLVVGVALLSLLVICLGWGFLGEPVNVRHMLIQHRLGRHDLSGLRLQGADLRGADLRNADLHNADLSGANLTGADLTDAFLGSAGRSGADLSDADLTNANLTNAYLGEVDLSGADLSDADLIDAHLRKANLRKANLSGADLSDADLSGANLTGADLTDADLTGADLRGATLDDSTQLDENRRLVWSILNEGGAGRDLGEADLRGADLRGADLSGADLSGADLSHADLNQAKLEGACLHGANLYGAYLFLADLRGADLRGADLSRADLSGANLKDAVVTDEQLAATRSLKGATLTDGTVHE